MAGIEGLLAGHTLGERYRIEAVIGRGGMAAVYRARDEVLGRTVAVKVIMVAAPGETGQERLRARFHREARAAARLQHPHVVTVYDFGTDPSLHLDYLVMELLRGEDLASRVGRAGPVPLDTAIRIVRQAAEGVGAGHRAGLIHRDVKPGNLFLAEEHEAEFRVRVLDFGIARILTGEDGAAALTRGSAPLSPAYAAPEQLSGVKELTPAADVYSLGVIAYELMTGARLFGGDSAGHVRSAVPPLRERAPAVPDAVARVVERALAADPAERYSDAEEMAHALEEAAAIPASSPAASPAPLPIPTPVAAPAAPASPASPPPGPRYRARRESRLPRQPVHRVPDTGEGKGRGAWPGALLALLVAVGAIGWWATRGEDPAETIPTVAAGDAVEGAAEDSTAGGLVAPPAGEEGSPTVDRNAPGAQPARAGSPATPPPGVRAPAGGEAASAGTGAPPRASAAPARSALALNAEGLRLFDRGNAAAAAERFEAAVRLAPRNAYYRNNLGWALFRSGRVEDASRELEEVVRMDPNRDIVYANIGEVRLAQGDTTAAIAAYRRFLELNRDPRRARIASDKLRRIGG